MSVIKPRAKLNVNYKQNNCQQLFLTGLTIVLSERLHFDHQGQGLVPLMFYFLSIEFEGAMCSSNSSPWGGGTGGLWGHP